MNEVKKLTLIDRFRNAFKAFKGTQVGSLSFGVDVKRCDQCEFKSDGNIREHLMVIMGARAAYMDTMESIYIPGGLEGEGELVWFVRKTVNEYLRKGTDGEDNNFDEFIETRLLAAYGKETEECLLDS
jgi:hypothetical protein